MAKADFVAVHSCEGSSGISPQVAEQPVVKPPASLVERRRLGVAETVSPARLGRSPARLSLDHMVAINLTMMSRCRRRVIVVARQAVRQH